MTVVTVKITTLRIGEVLCPNFHAMPRNEVVLKEDEGVGTVIKVQCGMCHKTFKGEVLRVRERLV